MNYKKLIWIILFLLALSVAFFISIPALLSTPIGKKIVVNFVQKKGYKSFSADCIKLRWFGPQRIVGLHFNSESLEFSAKLFETDMDFKSLINLSKLDNKAIVDLKTKILLEDASLKITDPNMPIANLSEINGNIVTSGEDRPITVLLTGKSVIDGEEGNFDISSVIGHEIKTGTITLKNFPTISFDELFFEKSDQNKGLISQILGQKSNLTSTFKIVNSEGTIFIDIASSNLRARVSANYSKGLITLNAPLDAALILSEKLSLSLLKDVNPLLIYGLKAFSPVKIKIPEGALSLPVSPLNLKELKIENAMVDFGKILTKNGPNISTIIGIMKYHSLEDVKEMTIWCTPVFIKIVNGKLFTSRMDALLADEIHICTWGAIDLASKKIKMTLGLTSQALERGFGIKDMPPDYVMKIPMKGTTDNPKIEKGLAAAKIAGLLALQSAEKKSIIGQIFDTIKHAAEDQSDVPPPYLPYPWEK